MIRINSGIYKGRYLKAPTQIRPTQEKVRKAVFDMLGDIEGLSFLELYAGSGIIGFEALSLGVSRLVLVEKERNCCQVIQENLKLLTGEQKEAKLPVTVINKDAYGAIEMLFRQQTRFDLIYLDPPYYQDMTKKTLQILGAYDILAPYGYIVCQHFKKDPLPQAESDSSITLFKQKSYGETLVSFYRHTGAQEE